eukprot:12190528-Karenia_brevis.AAC.1
MLEVAGLVMFQPHQSRGHEQPTGPMGPGDSNSSSRQREWGIRLSDQERSPGPRGLMSLGDMLQIA